MLAAGASARLGRPKQLVVYAGEPLVRRAARAALGAGARPVVVVLGARAEEVAPALDGLAGVEVVVCAEWARGLSASLAAGLDAVERAAGRAPRDPLDGVLLTVCDQPLVDAAALGAVLAAFGGPGSAAAAEYGGTVGVPAVVGRAHLPTLRALTGDAGAGRWLRAHPELVVRVPMPAAGVDVDTADDVARLGAG